VKKTTLFSVVVQIVAHREKLSWLLHIHKLFTVFESSTLTPMANIDRILYLLHTQRKMLIDEEGTWPLLLCYVGLHEDGG
jgi:hypothetical protein